MSCCAWQLDFLERIFFAQKMGQNQGFLDLLENLVINFFWIWFIKKFYNICCILAQIPYLGKIWFLRYGPKCSWPVRLQSDEKAWFFAYWCRFIEIKSWLKNIGVGMVKNGCGHSGLRTLKLAVSQEGINGVSWFLVCW